MGQKRLPGWTTPFIYLPLLLIGFSAFIHLNFGATSPQQVVTVISFGLEGIAGLGTMLKLEFFLLVMALPISTSLAILNAHSLARGRVAPIALALLLLVATAAVGGTFTSGVNSERTQQEEGSQQGEGSPTTSHPTDAQIAQFGTNIIHVFIEGMPPSLVFDSGESTRLQERLHEAVGSNSLAVPVNAGAISATIDGMASSMCGVTSLPPGFSDAGSANFLLTHGTCISDVLSSGGYTNLFLGAASGEFQLKQMFMEAHGFLVLERSTWQDIGTPSTNSWGQSINDDRLFSHARAAVNSLQTFEEKYYLVVLSLDTHYPYYLSEECSQRSSLIATGREAAYDCSVEQVERFIAWLRSNLVSPTTLVIQGDHPPPHGASSTTDVMLLAACLGGGGVADTGAPRNTTDIRAFVLELSIRCGAEDSP